MKPLLKIAYLIGLLSFLSACSTLNGPPAENDPFESYNRSVYDFNEVVDKHVLKPVSQGYYAVTPDSLQKGVSNFFSNLDDVIVIANDLFQLKFTQFTSDTARLLINSTLGLYGLIDWASDLGLAKHNEDFGQTLGYWGAPTGPYFVLPFLGPSNLRDTSGFALDSGYFDPVYNQLHEGFPSEQRTDRVAVWGMTSLKAVSIRASLLKAETILNAAALDRYTFIREAYFQRRLSRVYDGSPPVDTEDEFSEDELFED